MRPGQILVAEHHGVNVIKMVGDVRLTLCLSFDDFINDMFASEAFVSVVFDLSHAEAIDSTTLGLMAKISIIAQDKYNLLPVVISPKDDINRILETMGFGDIFEIVRTSSHVLDSAKPLTPERLDEKKTRSKILEAHKILMGLNADNQEEFKDLVQSLEQGA